MLAEMKEKKQQTREHADHQPRKKKVSTTRKKKLSPEKKGKTARPEGGGFTQRKSERRGQVQKKKVALRASTEGRRTSSPRKKGGRMGGCEVGDKNKKKEKERI